MNKDELTRTHLATVLRMAVRLGRLQVPDHAMDAELRDLAQIYLDATSATVAWDAIKLQGPAVPVELLEHRPYIEDVVAEDLREHERRKERWTERRSVPDTQANACGFALDVTDGHGVIVHQHRCQKAPGHDEGPGGSDHLCESCGCLYDTAGGTASPLLGAGLPLGGNGPAEEVGEIEP